MQALTLLIALSAAPPQVPQPPQAPPANVDDRPVPKPQPVPTPTVKRSACCDCTPGNDCGCGQGGECTCCDRPAKLLVGGYQPSVAHVATRQVSNEWVSGPRPLGTCVSGTCQPAYRPQQTTYTQSAPNWQQTQRPAPSQGYPPPQPGQRVQRPIGWSPVWGTPSYIVYRPVSNPQGIVYRQPQQQAYQRQTYYQQPRQTYYQQPQYRQQYQPTYRQPVYYAPQYRVPVRAVMGRSGGC